MYTSVPHTPPPEHNHPVVFFRVFFFSVFVSSWDQAFLHARSYVQGLGFPWHERLLTAVPIAVVGICLPLPPPPAQHLVEEELTLGRQTVDVPARSPLEVATVATAATAATAASIGSR